MKALFMTITTILTITVSAHAQDEVRNRTEKSINEYVTCSQAIGPAIKYIDYASIDGSTEGSEALQLPDSKLLNDGKVTDLQTLASKYRKTLIRQLSAVTAPTVVSAAELNNGHSVKENFRKALISPNHPCSQIKDWGIRSAFQNAGDAFVEGFITYSHKTST